MKFTVETQKVHLLTHTSDGRNHSHPPAGPWPASDQPLRGWRLRDAPHLYPRARLLLPAGAVGAVGGAAAQSGSQPGGGQDQNRQEDDGQQAGGQQEVGGQALRCQLQGEKPSVCNQHS